MKVLMANNTELVGKLKVAERFFSRLTGLLGRDRLDVDEALLIRPCKGIHTFGMRFPIDVLFLNKDNQVVALVKHMLPNRMTRIYFSATGILELSAGVIDTCGVHVGDRLNIACDA